MIKNTIISGLLVYMLAQKDGWAVAGEQKVFVCICLTILGSVLIRELEKVVRRYV